MTGGVLALAILAGAVGSVVRYAVQIAPARAAPSRNSASWFSRITPPWRIAIVNVVASFLAGLAVAVLPAEWEPVAVAGFCGGLSTWSTLMTDAHGAWRAGHRGRATVLVAAQLGYGLLAAVAGLTLGRLLAG